MKQNTILNIILGAGYIIFLIGIAAFREIAIYIGFVALGAHLTKMIFYKEKPQVELQPETALEEPISVV